jgi:1-acyl-sn-glycerol-3-phosphate acyltransferase
MRAKAPIVPVAVVGAEEAAPIFAHVPALQRLTGLIYFPITPTFPHFGLLGMLGYLPAKFRIRFLPPVPTERWAHPPDQPWQDKGLVQTVADEVRDTIQREVLEMVAKRRSAWL